MRDEMKTEQLRDAAQACLHFPEDLGSQNGFKIAGQGWPVEEWEREHISTKGHSLFFEKELGICFS